MVRYCGVGVLVASAFLAGTFVPVAWTQQGPIQGTGDYVVVNYMRVPQGKGPDYVALERGVWKASHEARVRDGNLNHGLCCKRGSAALKTPIPSDLDCGLCK